MIATFTIDRARELAYRLHAGQSDRDGHLHIEHVARVAAACQPADQIAAWLHDALEDTAATADCLRAAGVPERDIAAIEILTRHKPMTYANYIASIRDATGEAADRARRVKEHDLGDNLARSLASGDAAQCRYTAALISLYPGRF